MWNVFGLKTNALGRNGLSFPLYSVNMHISVQSLNQRCQHVYCMRDDKRSMQVKFVPLKYSHDMFNNWKTLSTIIGMCVYTPVSSENCLIKTHC